MFPFPYGTFRDKDRVEGGAFSLRGQLDRVLMPRPPPVMVFGVVPGDDTWLQLSQSDPAASKPRVGTEGQGQSCCSWGGTQGLRSVVWTKVTDPMCLRESGWCWGERLSGSPGIKAVIKLSFYSPVQQLCSHL
jgi:hypothetical protein